MTKNKYPPLLTIGIILRNRWLIQEIIGKGGYGQIFKAIDLNRNHIVAIKAEPTHRRKRCASRMILEQHVLSLLQGLPHSPIMFQSGVEKDVNFIVMEILSPNIGDLRKQCPLKRFSKSTSGRIVQQTIAGLRALHQTGFIYRDIKPANIVFGVTNNSKHRLVIIDYGLVRRFRNKDGTFRPRRSVVGFRGTLRYVSLRVHARQESGPADDLISLFYTFLELIRGSLPWRQLRHSFDVQESKKELQKELFSEYCKISENISDSIRQFGIAVSSISVEDEPKYTTLQNMIKDLLGNDQLNDPYDWHNNYKDVLAEQEINRSLNLLP